MWRQLPSLSAEPSSAARVLHRIPQSRTFDLSVTGGFSHKR